MDPAKQSKSYARRYLHAHQFFPLNVKMDTAQMTYLIVGIMELLRCAVSQVSKYVKTVFVDKSAWSTTVARSKIHLCALMDLVVQIPSHAKVLNTAFQ